MKKLLCLLLAVSMTVTLYGCKKSNGSKIPEYLDFVDEYTDSLPENAEDGLTLHAFNWTYNEIRENLESIANAGFKNILTMPVQQPKAAGSSWWAFYQPLSFSIADNSATGTKDDLIALCEEADKYGICILADIVINHMATTDDEGKEEDGTPMVYAGVRDYEPLIYDNRNEDVSGIGVTFHHNKSASGSGAETQYYPYGNLPDLDTSNEYVQTRVLALLKECIDVGIDGFRFDAAKHVETSKDPAYPSDFWESTLVEAQKYYKEKTGKNLYAYGEILNSPTGRSLSCYTDYMRVTDDGFIEQYKSAMSKKDATVILNASLKDSDPNNLIAWVESHDTYVSSNTHYSDVRVAKYWSVIAAKKGLGGLYLARPTDDLSVGKIGSYAFESEYVAVSNRFHNRFYAAESYESAEGAIYVNEKILPDDQGVLIVNVGDVDPNVTVEVKVPHLENGNYYDSLTGNKVVVHEHIAYVNFEANGFALITRSKDIHPQLDISERGGLFVGEKQITFKGRNYEEGYYYFNDKKDERVPLDASNTVDVSKYVEDGQVELHICLKNGKNELNRTFTFREVELVEGKFNVLNLNEKYLNGDYDIYIWSWSPGRWSKDYEIKDGIMLVDTNGMTGFLIGVFEKGYVITNPTAWDSNIIKQSSDISSEDFKRGFVSMSDF
ncbi:MAG: hypothetical protein IJM15_04530 [Erysipelotrichaceae bacterium]|nr:hypothetical protein [Erysipelotrichaceae bacterium]